LALQDIQFDCLTLTLAYITAFTFSYTTARVSHAAYQPLSLFSKA